MGRRVSLEKSQREAGGQESEGHKDHSNKHAACEETAGEPCSVLRSALVLPKQWPSNSEYGISTVATGSSSSHSASASNSSFVLAPETTSRDIRSPSRSSQIDSTAKSLFSSTSRALKRHASKLSLASSISFDKDEEGKMVWKLSGLGASTAEQESILLSSARKDTLKRAISAPFGFKHVTHTYQEQVRGLESLSRNELISEFSAIRAGQRADPQIRGIKTQSLPTQKTPSSPDSPESELEAFGPSTKVTSPLVQSCYQSQASSTYSSTASNARCSRAVGNFSRPASRTSFSPIPPPERISSLNACVPVNDVSEDALDNGGPAHCSRIYSQRASPAVMNPTSLLVGFNPPGQDGDIITVGQAISTADDSARHLKSSPLPMLPADLDDVPEDEEGFVHCESRVGHIGRGNRLQPLRHVQSFPSSRHGPIHTDRLTTASIDTQRHTTSLNEGRTQLALDDHPGKWPDSHKHQPCRDTKRFSIGLKPMCDKQDWEQDVDYCYEHAAEAESDFNWDEQAANFPVGLMPSVFDPCDTVEQSISQLQQLAGLGLHDQKHDSQESSVLSVAASIVDISRSTNSVGSLPELDYSTNSSRESMDWEVCHGRKRNSKPTRPCQPPSPAKSPKTHQGLGL